MQLPSAELEPYTNNLNIFEFLKIQNGRNKQRNDQHTLARQKNIQKK